MYLDFIKNDYTDKNKEELEQYINRDKSHLAKIIQTKITRDIENIVERWYELEDIGLISEDAMFLKLLKESEELYSFGYYVGSISLIGVASEELCKSLVTKHKLGNNNISQNDRINLIFKQEKLSEVVKNDLHQIRKTRNNYIHFNDESIYKNVNNIKNESHKVITLFKSILKEVVQVNDINYEDIVDKLVSSQEISFTEFKYKHRNLNEKINTIDLQLNPSNSPKRIKSIYGVLEIDIDGDRCKELTLVDLKNSMPVVVDLTLPQASLIRDLKLEEFNGIVATIISNISSIGQTEEWLLLDIHDMYRGKIEL
ncbi:DUF4145 domain-containing protein [Bacillus thuringiensis]|uniref:DUF4145 domain-containing protein n=1 Tax=Bacillus cereus group TaxID=86661 RepID=UPI000BF9ACCD|nr:DUF4145 domain-containing protein [Bacillus thuringiensis]PEW28494.1 hypothetical protein CN427_11730 [Bacillus thuringiensis]